MCPVCVDFGNLNPEIMCFSSAPLLLSIYVPFMVSTAQNPLDFQETILSLKTAMAKPFLYGDHYVDYMVNLEMTSLSRVFPQISTDAARDLMMKLSLLFIKQRENHIMA
jgi:hypothetical protein